MREQRTNIDVIQWLEDAEKDAMGNHTHDTRNIFNDVLRHIEWLEFDVENQKNDYLGLIDEVISLENQLLEADEENSRLYTEILAKESMSDE